MSSAERKAPWPVPHSPTLRYAFAHAPSTLAVTTLAGTITVTNSALADLLGRDPAAVVSSTLWR